MQSSGPRREYLDALRGLAVIIMIEAHLFDSWTRFPDRQTRQFAYSMILGGFGAPLFLFLAGVAVPLSAGSKFRRTGDVAAAARAVSRRGLEILGLAFLFRFQAWILGWSPARTLLRVDILNIMGPAIMAAASIWGGVRSTAGRFTAFAAATLAVAFVTPIVRQVSILAPLPDPIEAYIRPVGDLSLFVFFPWAAFVFAGAIVGLVLEQIRTRDQEHLANVGFAIVGLGVAYAAYQLSFRPTIYPQSHFWTTSPTFFFLRAGIMTAAIAVFYVWSLRPRTATAWSPLQILGKNSLFIYWIHVEMIYGVVSIPLRKSLSFGQSWIALAIFCVFMLWCVALKDRVMAGFKSQGAQIKATAGS